MLSLPTPHRKRLSESGPQQSGFFARLVLTHTGFRAVTKGQLLPLSPPTRLNLPLSPAFGLALALGPPGAM